MDARAAAPTVCEITVETGTVYFEPGTEGPGRLYARALEQSPRFTVCLDPPAVASILITVLRGQCSVEAGMAEAFVVCPLLTDRIRWDRAQRRFRIAMCCSIWTFAHQESAGSVVPEGHSHLCQIYYRSVLASYVGAFVDRELAGRASLDDAGEVRSAGHQALRRALLRLQSGIPLDPYPRLYETRLQQGMDPAEAFLEVREGMLRDGRAFLSRLRTRRTA